MENEIELIKGCRAGKDSARKELYTLYSRQMNVYDKGIRSSYEEIRSSGLRHNLFGERANGMMVPTQSMVHTSAMKLGKSGVTVNGGTIGGLDLMTIFTKDFWDKKGRNRRSRTLEVLKAYGDSTTVLLPEPIVH